MAAGSRWFCPGAVARKSHDEIAAELLRRGFNVLILNGDKKQLVFSDATCPPVNVMSAVSDDVELSEAIRTLYYDYQLDSAPFAVTGNMCISRGITFASKNEHFEFLFTHGISTKLVRSQVSRQMMLTVMMKIMLTVMMKIMLTVMLTMMKMKPLFQRKHQTR
jgi:hypothetical protein